MQINPKLISGKFLLTMICGISILEFTTTLCVIMRENPTGDLSDPVVFLFGALTGWIGTTINNYFRKREDL